MDYSKSYGKEGILYTKENSQKNGVAPYEESGENQNANMSIQNRVFGHPLRSIENIRKFPATVEESSKNCIKPVCSVSLQHQQNIIEPQKNEENIQKWPVCSLCRKNGEPMDIYCSHNVKDEDGKVTCPVLRKHICDICGATGDYSHTRSHCPHFLKSHGELKAKPKFRILSNGKATRTILHK